MVDEKQKTINTKNLLNILSRRLSGRNDTARCEYNVIITKLDSSDIIAFDPMFYIYPNRHLRNDMYRTTILDYGIHSIFKDEIKYKWNNEFKVVIDDHYFVEGHYLYKQYENANRRKWVKLKEG